MQKTTLETSFQGDGFPALFYRLPYYSPKYEYISPTERENLFLWSGILFMLDWTSTATSPTSAPPFRIQSCRVVVRRDSYAIQNTFPKHR